MHKNDPVSAPVIVAKKADAIAPVVLAGLTAEQAKKVKSGEFEIVNDGFGGKIRGPLKPWITPGQTRDSILLPVSSSEAVTQEEFSVARVNEELLLSGYHHSKTISALIAVPVPLRGRAAYVVYDSKSESLADPRAYLLSTTLRDSTWYQLGSRKVVYIGQPPALKAELLSAENGELPGDTPKLDPAHLFPKGPDDLDENSASIIALR